MKVFFRIFVFAFIAFSYLESNALVTTVHISKNDPTCFGATDGFVTIDSLTTFGATGGYILRVNTTPVQFFANVGDTIKNLRNGNFTITVIDLADNSFNFANFSIVEPFQISSFTFPTAATCFGICTGNAIVFPNGGDNNFTFLWDANAAGQTTAAASNLCAGKYFVTITDGKGCTAIDSTTITEPLQIDPNVTPTPVLCNGDATGSATSNPINGVAPFTYNWSTGTNGANNTEGGLIAGPYSVTVTDSDGCQNVAPFTITQPSTLRSSSVKSDVFCAGENNGFINTTVLGGTTPYTFDWADITIAPEPQNRPSIGAGTYTVTVTDNNGCTSVETQTLSEPAATTNTITGTNILCFGASTGDVTITVTGGTPGSTTFDWSTTPATQTSDNSDPYVSTITGLTEGKYKVTITNSLGCTQLDSLTLTEPTDIIPSFTNETNPSCNGGNDGSITASATGGVGPYTFNWPGNPNTNPLTGLTAGSYAVTVVDGNSCTKTLTSTLGQPNPILPTLTPSDVSCTGGNDGTILAAATDGTAPYTFNWLGNPNTNPLTGLTAGSYTVTVVDAAGCTTTATSTVDEPLNGITINSTPSDVFCFGTNTGGINITVNGGTPQYTFAWNDGVTTQNRTTLPTGTYTLVVTDGNGCTESESVFVDEVDEILVTMSADSVSCNGFNDGKAWITYNSGGIAPVNTFAWSDGGSTDTISAKTAGKYFVTITDVVGCTKLDSITIEEPTPLVIDPPVSTDPLCNNSLDGTITINVSGGTPGYSYLWNDSSTDEDRIGLSSGNYTVTVTDINGCTNSIPVVLNNPQLLTIAIDSFENVTCSGLTDGFARAAATGGIGAYTYNWQAGPNTAANQNLAAGTYFVTVTDNNGCTAATSQIITSPSLLLANATLIQDAQCSGIDNGSVTAAGSGGNTPYTYNWNPGNINSQTLTGLTGGTYTVTVTDSKGCNVSEAVIVNQPSAIAFTTSKTDLLCNGDNSGTATVVSPSGGTPIYTYLWTPGGANTQIASGLSAQSYTVLITDANGCTSTGGVIIGEPTILTATITSSADPSCNGVNDGTATVTGAGGTIATDYAYSWAPDGEITASISGKGAGTYTIIITDDNGCTATDQVTLNSPTSVLINTDTLSQVDCFGGFDGYIGVSASNGVAPYTFDWSNIPGAPDTPINAGISTGTYTVTVSDNNGCFDTQSFVITQPAIPFTASIVQIKQPCSGASDGVLTVTESNGTAPYTYNWTGTTQTTDTVRNLSAGFYLVNVTDANGCVAIANFTLTPSFPIVQFTASVITDVACFGDSTGSAGAIAIGGTGNLTFTWSNGDVTAFPSVVTNLKAGTYTVTVNDENACTDARSVVISEPNILDPNITLVNVSCSGTADGSISSTPIGGTSPYSFLWSNGNPSLGITGAISNLAPGPYALTITDANGCDTVETFTIIKDIINYTFRDSVVNETCNGICNGYIEIKDLTGGVAPITYSWSNVTPGNSPINANLCAGSYTVTISDGNSCDTVQTFTINSGLIIAANLTTNPVTCGASDGDATTTPTNGVAPYNFAWSPSTGAPASTGTTSTASNLGTGNYDVTITDITGCTVIEPFTIIDIPAFTFDTTVTNVLGCFGECTGSIVVSNLVGGTAPYTFTWNVSGSSNNIQNLCAGNYTLNLADANGCDTNLSFNISQPSLLVPNITLVNAGCVAGSTGSASSTPTGGNSPYNFVWSNGSPTSTGLTATITDAPGIYSLTVTDASGCDSVETFTILKDAANYVYIDSVKNETCFADCDGSIEIIGLTGGVAPISFNWSTGATNTTSLTNLCAGNYTVTISDAINCDSIRTFTINPGSSIISNFGSNNANCGASNGDATVTPSGGLAPYTFNWAATIGAPQTTGITSTVSNLAGGNYDITITDNAGCVLLLPFNINDVAAFTFDTTITNVEVCFGDCTGKIVISNLIGGTAPYTYTWDGTIGNDSIVGQCAGNYSLNISDATGCDTSLTFTIIEPTLLIPNLVIANASCSGATNGTATSTPTGGLAPYNFMWSTGINQSGLVGSLTETAGNYTLTVTDANGCDSIESFTIGGAGQVYSYTDTVSDMSCNGICDGYIEIRNLTGGVAPITFAWSNVTPGNSPINAGLCAGTYTLTISDANTCDSIVTYTIIEPNTLTATTSSISDTCVKSVGRAEVNTVVGGTTPYTYNWPGSISTTSIANNIVAGTYDVTIEDNAGCFIIESILVANFSTFSIVATVDSVSCKDGDDGEISISTLGGVNPVTYNWTGGLVGATPKNLRAGFYDLTVTDAAGCSDLSTIEVEEPDSLQINISTVDESCNPGNDGSALAFAIGGTPSYSFTWNAGTPIGNSTTGLTAGTYLTTVTDINGCEDIGFYDILPTAPFNVSIVNTKASCNGGSDGTVAITLIGAIPPVTYNWAGGLPPTSTQIGLAAGSYSVTITDGSTCSRTTSIAIFEEDPIAVNIVTSDESCSPGNDAFAVASSIGGVLPYTYTWLTGTPFNDSVADLSAGAYNVTVEDAVGCTKVEAFTIQSGSDLDGGAVIQDVTCFGGCDGSVILNPTGGTGLGFTFNWDDGTVLDRRDNLCFGSYRVTISDNAIPPCTKIENVFVGSPDPLTTTTFQNRESCSPGGNGGITFFPLGGTGPYTLQSSAGSVSGLNVGGLSAGSYFITLEDSKGCTISQPFTLNKATPPTITSSSIDATCNGGTDGRISIVSSGGTNPLTFNWTGGLAGANPLTAAGTYTVTITDGKGCEAIESVTVGEATQITTTFVTVGESCNPGNDGSVTATPAGGTGPYMYDWGIGITANNNNIGLTAGSYDVTITDNLGCTEIIPYIINSDAPFTLTSVVNEISCNGLSDGSIALSVTGASGALTYLWDNGPTPNNSSQSPLPAGIYNVTITDAGTGCTETANFNLIDPAAISITSTVTNESCSPGNDGTILLAVTGGTVAGLYTYLWDNSLPAADNQVGLSTGTYNVTVFDDNGCTSTESITISPSAPFNLDLDSTDIICNGGTDGTITAVTDATNPLFQWDNGLLPIANPTGLFPGTYCVTVTDDNGCTETDCIVINEPSLIAGIVITTPESCTPGSDGTASVTASGGTLTPPADYIYSWSVIGATGNSINGLSAGNYDVTIFDGNGCNVVVPFTIGSVAPYTVSLIATDVSCNGFSDGTIIPTTTAINPLFNWNTINPTDQIQLNLSAGTYTVTVTEPSSGCTETATINVNEPAILSANIIVTPENCNPGNDGTATASGSGGTSPYTFDWFNGGTGNSITGLSAGSYTVIVTDNSSCTSTIPFTIGSSAPFTVSLDSTDITCNGLRNGTITTNTTAVTPDFDWNNGLPKQPNHTGLFAGIYNVTVTDLSTNCSETASITINEPTSIVANVSTFEESCVPGNDGAASVLVSGGTSSSGNYTIAWSNLQSGTSISGLTAGNYDVTVTDDNACSLVVPFNVGSTAPFFLGLDSTDVSCNGLSDGTIILTTSAFNPTYQWSGGQPATKDLSALSAGTYSVTVTDRISGCTKTSSIVVNEPSLIVPTIITNPESCNPGNDGDATASAIGGDGNYTFDWSTGDLNVTSISSLSAGSYTVTTTDGAGCSIIENFNVGSIAPFTVDLDSTDASCNSLSDGTITLTTTAINASFNWNTSTPNSQNQSNLTAGTYNVTVTEPSSGCSETRSIVINEPTLIVPFVNFTDETCLGNNGTATGSATGGTTASPGVYSFAWSDGQSGIVATGLTAGNYDVTVTDDNGCTAIELFTIGSDAPFNVTIDSTDVTCNGLNDGTITLATNAINPNFSWDNGLPSQANHSAVPPGTYNVTVTEPSSNCTETGSITINEPTDIQLSFVKVDDGCANNFTGSANVIATGGTVALEYTYLWSNGRTTASIGNIGPFNFTVTVTDDNSCSKTGSIKINSPQLVQPNEVVGNESCNGACDASVALNPTGGSGTYSYLWNNGAITRTRTNLCGGNYLVTISDGLNCDTIVSIDIISNFPLINTIATTDQGCSSTTVCDGGAIVTSTGGLRPYTYDWPTGTNTGLTNDTAKSLCKGSYLVTVTDASGCSAIENVTIGGPDAITATFVAVSPGCTLLNGSLTVVAIGGSSTVYTYQWYDASLTALTSTSDVLSNVGSGIYFVDVTDNSGCSARFSSNLSDIGGEVLTLISTDASCTNVCDGQASVNFTCQDPNCSIEWFDAVTGALISTGNNTISNLCSGSYFVEVINNSGCKTIERFTIGAPVDYIISAQINDVSCNNGFDGSISLTVSGGTGSINYNWAPGPISGQGTASVSGLTVGTYSVTISDGSICDTVLTYQITEPSEIMASFNSIEANCGQSNGFINATVTGGSIVFDYDYQWFDATSNLIIGQVNPSISGLAAGTYFLRVQDDNSCEKIFVATVSTTDGPDLTIDSTRNVTCFDDNNGAIFTTVTGTNGPFTYNWLPQGQTNRDILNLTAGTYTVGVTNNIGCVTFDTVTITGPSELLANIAIEEASCGLCNGIARVTATGGSAPYTYLWSNGSIVDSSANLCGGSYSMVLSDASGCSKSFNFSVNTSGGPTGETVTVSNASCATSCDGSATVIPIGGTAPYTYLWLHNGDNTNSLNNLCAGNYTLQVSDVKGCSRSVNIDILSPSAMTINTNIVSQTCNSNPCDGSIRVDVNGGTAPYTYNWGPGSLPATNNQNGLCSGIYNLTVTDASGCSLIESISLANNGIPLSVIPTVEDVNCNGGCDGSLISNLTVLVDYNYQWFNDQGSAISPINGDLLNSVCAGDYFLEITSLAGGCKSYENVTVGEPDSISLASSIVKNISCNGACDGEIFISTIGGNILYQYSWDDINGQDGIPATNLCSGTYAVTATDANGCSATTSVKLDDPPVLILTINSSTDLNCSSDCNGSADVSSTGGTAPYTFDWSGGQSGSNPTDLCFGPNIVTLTDATGCSITNTVLISAIDTVVAVVPLQILYCGTDPIHLKGETQGSSVNSVAWYIGDVSTFFTSNIDTTINRPFGDYIFYLIASNGSCSDTTEFAFKVAPEPFVGLASSVAIFKDEIALFKLSNQDPSYSYLWSPGKFLNDSTIPEPQASPRISLTYTVFVTDASGCTFKDSINVIYSKDLKIPSGITPNGDGVNDVWEIDFLEDFPRATVMIYNRWGELLYEQKNGYSVSWDGTYEGKALPIGTYYYVIDLKSDRFEPLTGPITIVK